MNWDGKKDLSSKERFRGSIEISNLEEIDFSKLPRQIGGSLDIKYSKIKNFKNCPSVNKLHIEFCEIESMKGIPQHLKEITIDNSTIVNFNDFPSYVEAEYFSSSPLFKIRIFGCNINNISLKAIIKLDKYMSSLLKSYNYGFNPKSLENRFRELYEKYEKLKNFFPMTYDYDYRGRPQLVRKGLSDLENMVDKLEKLFFKQK